MITNLDELVAYTNELARAVPQISKEVAIRSEGLPLDALASLERELDMPPAYLHCIRKLGVYGVSIGYFALWPTFSRNEGLVESLVAANSVHSNGQVIVREKGLLIVGRHEANLICVGEKGGGQSDKVFYVDLMSSPVMTVQDIAPSFDVFMLLAGNLHELSFSFPGVLSSAIFEMSQCCSHFSCSEDQAFFWKQMTAELVS